VRISDFEFNDAIMYGSMYYNQALVEEVTHKKVLCSCKKIDETTTEFNFVVLAK
jgi:hypothetical protein